MTVTKKGIQVIMKLPEVSITTVIALHLLGSFILIFCRLHFVFGKFVDLSVTLELAIELRDIAVSLVVILAKDSILLFLYFSNLLSVQLKLVKSSILFDLHLILVDTSGLKSKDALRLNTVTFEKDFLLTLTVPRYILSFGLSVATCS